MSSGIWGYGVSIPIRRIAIEDIQNVWKNMPLPAVRAKGVRERGVIGPDEDTITMGADAAFNALKMSGLRADQVGALILGTQTSPYLTRPSASILVEVLGLKNNIFATDLQFSGKSGTSAILTALAYVNSGMAEAAIAIGADTLGSHVSPGDSQEYTAAAGAGAVVIARGEGIAAIESTASYSTDTPDGFRLDGERYIRTGGSAMTNTGVGMQNNVMGAWNSLNAANPQDPGDFKYLVIQQQDAKAPFRVGQKIGFAREQIAPGLISDAIGDCGSATPLIALSKVLDQACAGEKIAMVSYGSGAGSDAIILEVTPKIEHVSLKPSVDALMSKKTLIDYATCVKLERKYHTHERKVSTFD